MRKLVFFIRTIAFLTCIIYIKWWFIETKDLAFWALCTNSSPSQLHKLWDFVWAIKVTKFDKNVREDRKSDFLAQLDLEHTLVDLFELLRDTDTQEYLVGLRVFLWKLILRVPFTVELLVGLPPLLKRLLALLPSCVEVVVQFLRASLRPCLGYFPLLYCSFTLYVLLDLVSVGADQDRMVLPAAITRSNLGF